MDPVQRRGPWTPGPRFVLTHYFLLFVDLFLSDMIAVRVFSMAVDTLKEQMAKILFLFLSEQGWMLIMM